ncbi:Fcf2 pre-rRNA processing-domain-containing protein, partial [Chytridium lagenaria]
MPPTLDMSAKEKRGSLAKEAETTGPGWFNMKAPDLTDEIKRDLEVIRSRAALDPKRKSLPKFFQIGTVMDSATDFYSGRLSNKERKNGILEELMADRDTKASLKKRFTKIQVAKEATAKPYRRPVATMRGKSKKVALSTSAKKKMRM